MVNTSTQQVIHYSESSSSASQVSNGSDASGTSKNHSHRLAANVPKKRTGRRVFRETRHPVYRGVRSRKGGRWVCEVREPNTGTRVWLGTYTNPEMAARAHDVAALAFRGKSACLNFADSAWRLPVPSSVDANDIRRAAAEAAEMFRPGAATVPDEQECSNSYVEAAEEEVVEVPRFVWEMAEGGILMSPPPSYGAESYGWSYVESCNNNNNAADYDWSLWNY